MRGDEVSREEELYRREVGEPRNLPADHPDVWQWLAGWSLESAVARGRLWVEESGGVPRFEDWMTKKRGDDPREPWPTYDTARKLAGSWRAFVALVREPLPAGRAELSKPRPVGVPAVREAEPAEVVPAVALVDEAPRPAVRDRSVVVSLLARAVAAEERVAAAERSLLEARAALAEVQETVGRMLEDGEAAA